MKLPELPEPDFTHGGRDWPVSGGWEESTVQAYGEACYRAALAEAAKARRAGVRVKRRVMRRLKRGTTC